MAVITESFNTADSDTLGPDLSWTELQGDTDIVSNTARSKTGTTRHTVRANSDLATSDHYAQALCNGTESDNNTAGVMVRKDSSATLTFYHNVAAFPGNLHQIIKTVANSLTTLASVSRVFTAGTAVTMRLEVTGSTLTSTINGAEDLVATDSDISGNVRTGLRGFGITSIWDTFEAGDLGGSESTNYGGRFLLNVW